MFLQAVIFDFDGVIADTERLHYLAFERILEPFKLTLSWEEYVDTCIGFDDRAVFQYRFRHQPAHLEKDGLENFMSQKAQAFLDLVDELGAPIYPGVEELVAELRGVGIPIGLCTGAVRSDISKILAATLFADAFSVQVTADDVRCSKPDPEGYELAARALCPNLGQDGRIGIIAIEDTPTGLMSAIEAGLTTIGVTTTHPISELGKARLVVESLQDLNVTILSELLS